MVSANQNKSARNWTRLNNKACLDNNKTQGSLKHLSAPIFTSARRFFPELAHRALHENQPGVGLGVRSRNFKSLLAEENQNFPFEFFHSALGAIGSTVAKCSAIFPF